MTTQVKMKRLHITLGELIAAIMDAAKKVTTDERDAYDLTGFVLNEMLRPRTPDRGESTGEKTQS